MKLVSAFILAACLGQVGTAAIASVENSGYKALAQEGIGYAYNMEVEQATETFQRLIELEPRNPEGYVLQAVNYYYQTQFEDENKPAEKQFKKHASAAIKRAKNRLASEQHGVDALFWIGTANMYLAAYHGGQDNWLRSYWYGKEGIKHLEKVIAIDPEYYDAYLGLGVYHYYADVMPRFLKVVTAFLGLEGDRKKGLRELKLAANRGTYTQAEALFFLSVIYSSFEQEEERAVACTRKLLERYPKNRGFLVFHGENLREAGRHELAKEVFGRTLRLDNSLYPFFDVYAHYSLGNIHFELNDVETAMRHYNEAVALAGEKADNMKWALSWTNLKLGDSFEVAGHREQAVQHYKRVEKTGSKRAFEEAQAKLEEPLSPLGLEIVRARNYRRTKQFDLALATLDSALAEAQTADNRDERIPEAHFRIGRVLYEMKAFDRAIRKLSAVLQINSQEEWVVAYAHYYLGKCYWETGRVHEALSEFDRAYEYKDNSLRFKIDKIRDLLNTSASGDETSDKGS